MALAHGARGLLEDERRLVPGDRPGTVGRGIDEGVSITGGERGPRTVPAHQDHHEVVEVEEPPPADRPEALERRLDRIPRPFQEDERGVDPLQKGGQRLGIGQGARVLAVELGTVDVVARVHPHPHLRIEAIDEVRPCGIGVERVASHPVVPEIVGPGDRDVAPHAEPEAPAARRAEGIAVPGEPGCQAQERGDHPDEPRPPAPAGGAAREEPGRGGRNTGEGAETEVGDVPLHAEREGEQDREQETGEGAAGWWLPAPDRSEDRESESAQPEKPPGDILPHHVRAGELARERRLPLVDLPHEGAAGEREGELEQGRSVRIQETRGDQADRQGPEPRGLAQVRPPGRIPAARRLPGREPQDEALEPLPHRGQGHDRRPEDESAVQVGPDDLNRQEGPERDAGSRPAPRQEEEEERGQHVGEDVRPLHDARRREDHHEGESRDGHARGGPERAGRPVQRGGAQESGQRLQGDEAVQAGGGLHQAEDDARQPLVRDERPAVRQSRVVVDVGDVAGGENQGTGAQMQEDVVVRYRGNDEGGDEERQRGERRDFASTVPRSGRHAAYLRREAIRALTALPSTRPR